MSKRTRVTKSRTSASVIHDPTKYRCLDKMDSTWILQDKNWSQLIIKNELTPIIFRLIGTVEPYPVPRRERPLPRRMPLGIWQIPNGRRHCWYSFWIIVMWGYEKLKWHTYRNSIHKSMFWYDLFLNRSRLLICWCCRSFNSLV